MQCFSNITNSRYAVWGRSKPSGIGSYHVLSCTLYTGKCFTDSKETTGTIRLRDGIFSSNLRLRNYPLSRDGNEYGCRVYDNDNDTVEMLRCRQHLYYLPPDDTMYCNLTTTPVFDNVVQGTLECNTWKTYPRAVPALFETGTTDSAFTARQEEFQCNETVIDFFSYQTCTLTFYLAAEGQYRFRVLVRPDMTAWEYERPELFRMVPIENDRTVIIKPSSFSTCGELTTAVFQVLFSETMSALMFKDMLMRNVETRHQKCEKGECLHMLEALSERITFPAQVCNRELVTVTPSMAAYIVNIKRLLSIIMSPRKLNLKHAPPPKAAIDHTAWVNTAVLIVVTAVIVMGIVTLVLATCGVWRKVSPWWLLHGGDAGDYDVW